MRSKMGTVVPKMGTTVHLDADQTAYGKAIADALRRELGPTHQAIKTVMRWTGASERTAKYWLSGERGPSGEHLIRLAQHSDAVLITTLAMAGGDCRRSSGTDVQAVQNGFLCYNTSDRMTLCPRDHHSFRCTNWSGHSGSAEISVCILRIFCGVFPCACGECSPQSPHLARRIHCTSGNNQTGQG